MVCALKRPWFTWVFIYLFAAGLGLLGCEAKVSQADVPPPAVTAPMPGEAHAPLKRRLVAIGDVHGDYEATKQILALSGLIDAQGKWSGGKTVVVQTGDVLDRGDGERQILDLFERLKKEARAAGGEFLVLNGNHELMNALGDLRYVTPGAFEPFADLNEAMAKDPRLEKFDPKMRPRIATFLPGGSYAKKIADQPIIAIVGDSVFAHGGVRLAHLKYGIERLNQESNQWLLGRAAPPEVLNNNDSPVWTRIYSEPDPTEEACEELEGVLRALGVKRMIVGHTVQRTGITAACDEQVWRIDVGMAKHYGGHAAALEIIGEQVKTIR